MTIPAYKDVDLALLLELVRRRGTPVRPVEIYDDVARHFPQLTQDDQALTRSDGRTKVFFNMIHWARDRIKERLARRCYGSMVSRPRSSERADRGFRKTGSQALAKDQ